MENISKTEIKTISKYIKTQRSFRHRGKTFFRQYKKNKTAVLGLFIFVMVLLCAVFANLIIPYAVVVEQDTSARLLPPSLEHFFGTDLYGRDVFARIIHGSRFSLLIGAGAVLIGISCGCVFGSASGYYGGMIDKLIMRIMDTMACIPFILLALTVVSALGPGLFNLLIALMVAYIPQYTRIIRSAVLSVVGQDFIEVARSLGTPDWFIILKHIIPNAIGVIVVQATMSFGKMIISASTLSFLGMGIQPPSPEWGAMLAEGKDYLMMAPHLVMFPGFAIVLTVLSLNLMGDGLRDALDPRLKD